MLESKELVENAYGLSISAVKSCRAGYILDTDEGRKYLKPCQCSESRILYVHDAKQYLYNNGFTNLDTYCLTVDGCPYSILDGRLYLLTSYAEGHECEFGDDKDAVRAAYALAAMHKAGKGFKHDEDSYDYAPDNPGKISESLTRRYDEMIRMRRKSERERGAFDYVYLGCVDKFTALAEESLELIRGPEYQRLIRKTAREGGICHRDYSYQNIIIKGETTTITGFESCGQEIRIYDLVNLIRRKMRKCDWDISKASMLLDAYTELEPLSRDEIVIMKAMLLFPQKFWRVANRYYNSRRSWAQRNFSGMLEEVIAEYDHHIRFMKQYDKLF